MGVIGRCRTSTQAKIEDFVFFAKDNIFFAKDYVFFSKDYVFFTKDYVLFAMDYIFFSKDYPASAGSARARRACALRALGLLLADGAPTVGWGKTFWCIGRFFLRKGPFLGNQKSKNQSQGAKSTVLARPTNGPLTKSRVL